MTLILQTLIYKSLVLILEFHFKQLKHQLEELTLLGLWFSGCRENPGRVGGLSIPRGRHQAHEARHGPGGGKRERRGHRDAIR